MHHTQLKERSTIWFTAPKEVQISNDDICLLDYLLKICKKFPLHYPVGPHASNPVVYRWEEPQ